MIRHLIITLILITSALSTKAQESVIKLWADQKVFITGEDMWIDGVVEMVKPTSRSLVIQLIDRNGNKKADAEVLFNGSGFSGFITVPSNLPSDYYFLDAYTAGSTVKTYLFPVMIINPKLPPSTQCTFSTKNFSPKATSDINIYTDKDEYRPRSEVKLSLTGLTQISSGYISVVKNDVLNTIYEQATDGFNTTNIHSDLSEQENEGKRFAFLIKKDGKPVSGITVLASLKGSAAKLSIASSDQNGILKFLFPFAYETSEIILHSLSEVSNMQIEPISLSTNLSIDFPCLKIDETTRTAIESRVLNNNITKQFYTDLHRKVVTKGNDTTDFYGKPDVRYFLDDYVRFPNMEEVIAEIIPELRVKKEKDDLLLQVLNAPFKYFFTNQPLILIDGVPFFNTKELLESDPLAIKSIDIIKRKYILGDHEFDGVVHFKTYRNDMGSLKPSEKDKSFPFKGLQRNTLLKEVFEEKTPTTLPDFRNTLFTRKEIQSDFRGSAQFNFQLSDATGEFTIIFRGLDKSGNTKSSYKSIIISR